MKTKFLIIVSIIFLSTINFKLNAQNYKLYGTFCSYSSSGYGSSSYSTSEHVYFDGKGHYQYGSNSSYSGGGDGYYGKGDVYAGTYRIQGKKVILTSSYGEVFIAYVYFTQSNGQVTELSYDGTLFGKSLCN